MSHDNWSSYERLHLAAIEPNLVDLGYVANDHEVGMPPHGAVAVNPASRGSWQQKQQRQQRQWRQYEEHHRIQVWWHWYCRAAVWDAGVPAAEG